MNSGKIEFSFLPSSVLLLCNAKDGERKNGRKEGEGRRKGHAMHTKAESALAARADGRRRGMCGEGGAETSPGEPRK